MITACQRILARGLYRVDKWRLGESATFDYLRAFERTQYARPDEIRGVQLDRLRALVRHAELNCPFYARSFAEYGVNADTLDDLAALSRLPILEKRHIQQHGRSLVATNWPAHDLLPNFTGGSTGQPLSLFLNKERKCSREAATHRHNQWAGWRIGDKVGHIWGAAFDLRSSGAKTWVRNQLIDRSITFNSGNITEGGLLAFHERLTRFRPRILHGYAKSTALLARYLKDKRIPAYQPKAIVTSAEMLLPTDRRMIEDVFGCSVFNRYGCRETSVIASECDRHDGLHLMSEGIMVEVVNGDDPAPAGERGSILVTDLLNYAMPLIRYRIGDMGTLREGSCACGRGLPLLDRVDGRITDFLVGTDGRLVSGPFLSLYLIGKRPTLGQAQIVQDTAGQVLIRVTSPPSNADVRFVEDACVDYLGAGARVDFELVDAITRTRSGKLLLTSSTAATDFVELVPTLKGAAT